MWSCFVDVFRLNALSSETDERVADTFDFGVDRRFTRQNNDDQLKTVVSRLEKFKHRLDLFDASCVFAEAWLPDDRHASVVRNSLQLLSERSKRGFVAVTLRSETRDCPRTNFDARVKLFATHVPNALVGRDDDLRSAAVLDLRCVENSAHDFGHVGQDIDAEMCDVNVVVELSFAYLRGNSSVFLGFELTDRLTKLLISFSRSGAERAVA